MAEMADVCSTHQPYRNNGNNDDGTLHPLKTILNWLSFFFQILLQIIRDTPSWAQVLTYVGFRKHHLLLSSDTSDSSENGLSSPTVFKTLRAELEMVEEEDSTLVFGPACPALPPAYSNGVLEKMTVSYWIFLLRDFIPLTVQCSHVLLFGILIKKIMDFLYELRY